MSQHAFAEILLVEDNPADAEMTMRALKRCVPPNAIEWVQNGEEAVDYMLRQGAYATRTAGNPKLILMDLKMPKLDGVDVLRLIKGNLATRAVPVVMLTSSNEDSDITRCYDLGVNSYIVKPVEFDKFVDEVSKLGLYWAAMNKVPGPAESVRPTT